MFRGSVPQPQLQSPLSPSTPPARLGHTTAQGRASGSVRDAHGRAVSRLCAVKSRGHTAARLGLRARVRTVVVFHLNVDLCTYFYLIHCGFSPTFQVVALVAFWVSPDGGARSGFWPVQE